MRLIFRGASSLGHAMIATTAFGLATLAAGCGDGEGQATRSAASGQIASTKDDADDNAVGGSADALAKSADATVSGPRAIADAVSVESLPTVDVGPDEQEAAAADTNGDGTQFLSSSGTNCYKGDAFACAVEVEILRLTNVKRSGLVPLAHDPKVAFVSRDWSKKQARQGEISHTGFPGSRAQVYQTEFSITSAYFVAENVAMSSAFAAQSAASVAAVFVEMWYKSEGHKRNMLGNFRRLGAGVYRAGSVVYATQLFTN